VRHGRPGSVLYRQMRFPALLLACCALAAAPAAAAADTGNWIVTSSQPIPNDWRQGLATSPGGTFFFAGPFQGIHETRDLVHVTTVDPAIPADVAQHEQYNHFGDIAWDAGEGGRLLLPLESYQPVQQDTNPSKTGSIGVLSANTLAWSYYVKLDPSEIAKAQWIVPTPDGLFWTPTGKDLLAYRLADINPANAAPGAAPLHSVRRLPGVVPDGAGGGVAFGGRLYMSGGSGGIDRIVSLDTATGAVREEFARPGNLEPEGMDAGAYLGGVLHVEYVNGLAGGQLLSLLPKGAPLKLKLSPSRHRPGRTTTIRATVTASSGGFSVALAGVRVKLGQRSAKTDARGRATLRVKLGAGRYRAGATYPALRSARATLR
jgi:hypothetical protein